MKQYILTTNYVFLGISPVEDIKWFNDTKTMSWSRPSFYSQDVIGYSQSDTNYNVLLDGISIVNTTNTSVALTSSPVNVLCAFTVSITASLQQYVSEEKQEVIDNTGSKLLFYIQLFYFLPDYTVRIDNNSTANFDRASGAFNVNLTVRINF